MKNKDKGRILLLLRKDVLLRLQRQEGLLIVAWDDAPARLSLQSLEALRAA